MKLKKIDFGKLFYNNRFLLVFSLVLAVLIWLYVSVEYGEEITRTIRNVPVQIDSARVEESLGLTLFSDEKFTVDVTVTGKRYIVEQEGFESELVATASTGAVSSAGEAELPVTVESAESQPSFTIQGWSIQNIRVSFDYAKEKEFAVEADVQVDDSLIPEGYFMGDCSLESTTVRISGPENVVNSISRVVARASVEDPVTANLSLDATLTALNRDGNEPQNARYLKFNRKSETMKVTVPVYKRVTLPATVSFSGRPPAYIEDLPFTVTVSPETAVFGVAEDNNRQELESFEIAVIPFSSIHEGETKIRINASELTGGVIADETTEFVVTVSAPDLVSVKLKPKESLNFINGTDGVSAATDSLNFKEVTVVGPPESLAALTEESLVLNADLSDIPEGVTGTVVVPVSAAGNDYWLSGEYTASVNLQ